MNSLSGDYPVTEEVRELVSGWLEEYEGAAEASQGSGVSLVGQEAELRWNYPQSVFFVATVLTTIGELSYCGGR